MEQTDYKFDELKRLREAKGFTQEQVAQELSVDRQTVYRAEAGSCSYKLLRSLATFYGVDILSLLHSSMPAKKQTRPFLATV